MAQHPVRLFDILEHLKLQWFNKEDIFAAKENGEWKKCSVREYIQTSYLVAYALLEAGVKKGDKIATIMNNRPEWNFLDMGIMMAGAIHVPVYPTISKDDYKYILNHAEVKILFVSGEDIFRKIRDIVPEIASLEKVYSLSPSDGTLSYSDFQQLGQNHPRPEKLREITSEINGDDIATLIYTSGTTGVLKGVMLSHQNIISNMLGVIHIPPFVPGDIAFSYLPLCHVYERMLNYTFQYLGYGIYYAENMGTIAENIREVKPTIMCSVPRLLEKVYDKIIAKGKKLPFIQKNIFFWAVKLGLNYRNTGNPIFYRLQLFFADLLVFSKWRKALGGNFKIIVSGGAAIQVRLLRVFGAAGITILEGYGLTETSPVIAVSDNTLKNGVRFGTVGPILKGVEVKIAEDGEVLAKGPNVMKGYYKNPELTAEVIDLDGWFHTGDTGVLEDGIFLRLTGRKKEIFKTSMGKYISPELIENKLKESPFIENAMVVGENQKFAAALIIPNFEHLKSYCQIKQIPFETNAQIIQNPLIVRRLFKEVEKVNQKLGEFERIKKIELVASEWNVENGEFTPTLKLKRRYIAEKYADLINKMFNVEDF